MDLTNLQSDIVKLIPYILEDQTIQPEQVINYKVKFHQEYNKKWINEKIIR